MIQYDPTGIFEQMNKGGVCEIKRAGGLYLVAGGAEQTIIPAVSGKKIMIVSAIISPSAAAALSLRSNSTSVGGDLSYPAATVDKYDFNIGGWWETATGEALKAVVITATISMYFRYIEYTP